MRPLFFVLFLTHGLLASAAASDDLPPPPPPPEPPPASTNQPKFSSGGGIFGLQYGPGFWGLDEAGLESQLPAGYGHVFVTDANTDKSWQHTAGIRIGYNILGHASIELNIVGTGWNIFNNKRGGAGFATGVIAWHPLQLVFMNKPERPIPLDVSMAFGVGYGIAGQTFGMDGLVLQWGMNAEWFFTKFFALGLFVKGTFLQWHTFYLDFDNKVTMPLPKGSGGAFWFPGLEVIFRFGE
jgi:hypothetical protein